MTEAVEHCDVVVVGAGIAGLTAARELTRAGSAVICLEARNRVGGRASSIQRTSTAVDLGATWFWHNEPHVRALTDELGLGVFPQYLDGDALFEADHRGPQRLDGNPLDGPSSRFVGGAQSLPEQLSEDLADGVLRVGNPVHRIRSSRDSILIDSCAGTFATARVIVAVPPALAVETITFTPYLPAPLREIAARTAVWMGDVVKAVALYDEPFWRDLGLSGSAISYQGPFREFHDHSGPGGHAAALFAFAPARRFDRLGSNALEESFRRQLSRMFGARAARLREIHYTNWSTERFTTPATPLATASTDSYGHTIFQEPVADGRIHWASTETATSYAGHLEGAIRAGITAARRILEASPKSVS